MKKMAILVAFALLSVGVTAPTASAYECNQDNVVDQGQCHASYQGDYAMDDAERVFCLIVGGGGCE
jgi:hypothetical protein